MLALVLAYFLLGYEHLNNAILIIGLKFSRYFNFLAFQKNCSARQHSHLNNGLEFKALPNHIFSPLCSTCKMGVRMLEIPMACLNNDNDLVSSLSRLKNRSCFILCKIRLLGSFCRRSIGV